MGYQDPKSGGDTFGDSEALTTGQANIIIGNQRHFAVTRLMSFQQMTDVDPTLVSDVCLFNYGATPNGQFAWCAATDNADTSKVGVAYGPLPNFQDEVHGLTMTGNTSILSVNSRPGDSAWFGLQKTGATSQGYLRWTGSVWTAHNRVYATGSSGDCRAIAYSPDEDTLVAAWGDSIEYNTSGSTWTGVALGAADAGQMLWGNGKFVGCSYTGAVSQVVTSTDGQAWASTPLGATLTGRNYLAFDYGENKWYIVNNTMANSTITLYSSSSPGSSWDLVPNVTNPDLAGASINGIAVYGGLLVLFTYRMMFITRDFGVTWSAYPTRVSDSGTLSMVKTVGGRIVVSFDTAEVICTDPFVEPLPGQ